MKLWHIQLPWLVRDTMENAVIIQVMNLSVTTCSTVVRSKVLRESCTSPRPLSTNEIKKPTPSKIDISRMWGLVFDPVGIPLSIPCSESKHSEPYKALQWPIGWSGIHYQMNSYLPYAKVSLVTRMYCFIFYLTLKSRVYNWRTIPW